MVMMRTTEKKKSYTVEESENDVFDFFDAMAGVARWGGGHSLWRVSTARRDSACGFRPLLTT